MAKRYVYLWFRHLTTDWFTLRRPALANIPFVLAAPDHGRMLVTAANKTAEAQGIITGMTVADARILNPSVQIMDDKSKLPGKLLRALALWCIRFTPVTAPDLPGGLILDTTGCAHLWGSEQAYLKEIIARLRQAGYDVRGAMASTIGTAWAFAHYGKMMANIEPGGEATALLSLPPVALRLDPLIVERLQKLGLYRISNIIGMPRGPLRRRFGKELLLRLDQALGAAEESIQPVQPIAAYQERLPCLEPIRTATGIEIALTRLLDSLCDRLQKEGKGLRDALFSGYRVDGKAERITIGTNRPSHNSKHLFKLFEEKIPTIEPDLGIELFTLESSKVEELATIQESLWSGSCGIEGLRLSELLDRIGNKVGNETIHRYLPAEHYWPERAIQPAASLTEKAAIAWPNERPRPIYLLPRPEPIEVTAPIPDYPPMLFRYKGRLHKITRADGPERIENEWWLEGARHRDYYAVEDDVGARYWLFRSGHYTGTDSSPWFIHGFFA